MQVLLKYSSFFFQIMHLNIFLFVSTVTFLTDANGLPCIIKPKQEFYFADTENVMEIYSTDFTETYNHLKQ